jgi:putative PIN family toxin of toxin-antitoxin system
VIVVFDSGNWISAIRYGGVPRYAILRAVSQDTIVICDEIEAEVIRIMLRKFGVIEREVRFGMDAFLPNSVRVTLTSPFPAICRDPKDDFLLECATLGHADLLVTGDKDLLTLESFRTTRILTPRQYLDLAQPQRAR